MKTCVQIATNKCKKYKFKCFVAWVVVWGGGKVNKA